MKRYSFDHRKLCEVNTRKFLIVGEYSFDHRKLCEVNRRKFLIVGEKETDYVMLK